MILPVLDPPKPEWQPNDTLKRLAERGLIESFEQDGQLRFGLRRGLTSDEKDDLIAELIREVEIIETFHFNSMLTEWYLKHPGSTDWVIR